MNKDARLLPGHIVANHPEFIVSTHDSLEAAVTEQRTARANGRKLGVALNAARKWAVVDIDAYNDLEG